MVRKWFDKHPWLKWSLVAVGVVLWLFGLSEQLPDLIQTAKYVGISLLMLVVTAI